MLKRESYLKKIRGFYNEKNLIKILYGMRRSGKSVILKQIISELRESGVDESHIIYINFELLDNDIKNGKDLDNYIKDLTIDNKTYYVFLDEIQKVEEFEKGINSLRVRDKSSIFITGSNSRMTASELSTDLTGRYVKFKINPLSFKEVTELLDISKDNYESLLHKIFEWGTLPQRFSYEDESMTTNYILDVYDAIFLKDIVERLGIKDITAFNKVLQYILEIEGREFSSTNVLKFLSTEYCEISSQTLYNYLDALCSTFVINKVYRYDIVGKTVLKTLNKYYVSDLGVRKVKRNKNDVNYAVCLENLVFNDLIVKGYEVYIGKTRKGEIDFIAKKNDDTKYIQVCYQLSFNEDTINREFSAFEGIDDGYSKYVISLDKENYTQNGIKHINAIDFFLNDDF